jgi:hypothetical protein
MQRFIGMALAAGFALGPAVAAAQPPGPQDDRSQGSMRLAILVGGYAPTLSAAQKAVLAQYGAGKTDGKTGKVVVKADQISCTAGAKAETAFACDLKFGATPVHLTARAASQVFAALEMIGAWSPAPFGPYAASVSAVSCTLTAATIAGGNDGGADCAYTPTAGAAPAADASASPPSPLKVDNDASLLVAALVGGNSPTLSATDKAALTHYLAGQPATDASLAKFPVSATKVLCTSSNRSEITWSCDLKFAAKTVHLTAAPAAELYAALMLAGLQGQAAMGTDEVGTAPLTCAIDPAAIAAGAGGAACVLTETEF